MKHTPSLLASVLIGTQPLAWSSDPPQRRLEVIHAAVRGEAAIPLLKETQSDPDAMVRRAAVRSLEQIGAPGVGVLREYLSNDPDALVRRTALRALALLVEENEFQKLMEACSKDESELVRVAVVEELSGRAAQESWAVALLQRAQGDRSTNVSQQASQALWPYHAEVVSARNRPEYQDSALKVLETLPLPEAGWKFRPDKNQSGHLEGWQKPEFHDADWSDIRIGQIWQNFGHRYEGVAWYRLRFSLPDRPDCDAVDLVFDAVDESAWIWINGEYAGAHDIGGVGWDKRFAVDTRNFLKWGQENQITVRVAKPVGEHAGIWKPAYLEMLKK